VSEVVREASTAVEARLDRALERSLLLRNKALARAKSARIAAARPAIATRRAVRAS